tara:strand:+ start:910 stop:1545 length:636 start_codon:yes stop_codon:yes gene_type:complete
MIILFNGPPASGKDCSADYFKQYGFKHLSFKYQLFKATFKYFDVTEQWFMESYDDRSVKERPSAFLGGMSRREAMIHVSENVIKPKFGLDYFGKAVAEEVDVNVDYVISDGGFVDELFPIINKIGSSQFVLVQLTRDGCDFSTDSRRYLNGSVVKEYVNSHATPIQNEYVLPHKFDIRTYRIHNNSSVDSLLEVLEEIHEKECNVRTKESA